MKLLDVVAVLEDIPESQLSPGQVGTVVEELDKDNVLVEFADLHGAPYRTAAVNLASLILLKHSPERAA